MQEQETYQRKKTFKQSDYLTGIALMFSFFVLHAFLNPIFLPWMKTRNLLEFYSIISVFVIFWVFTLKRANKITIDFANKQLLINYVTLFSQNNEATIAFTTLSYEYKKSESKIKPGDITLFSRKKEIEPENILIIFSSNEKQFELKEGPDYFCKDVVDKIIETLAKEKVPKKIP